MDRWQEMVLRPIWHRPSGFPEIAEKEVHVWRGDCRAHAKDRDYFASILDREEGKRAGRFVGANDRERYIVNHGLLRCLLSRYTGRRPEDLVFERNDFGKPSLKGCVAERSIDFNLSDSGSMSLVAVGCGLPVGVDIEGLRPLVDRYRLAQDVFVGQELMLVEGLGGKGFEEGFFFCWTRKEAVIKAMGKGLSVPLKAFSTLPGYRMRPSGDDGGAFDGTAGSDWKIVSFSPAKGFFGALATGSYAAGITFFELPDGLFVEEASR